MVLDGAGSGHGHQGGSGHALGGAQVVAGLGDLDLGGLFVRGIVLGFVGGLVPAAVDLVIGLVDGGYGREARGNGLGHGLLLKGKGHAARVADGLQVGTKDGLGEVFGLEPRQVARHGEAAGLQDLAGR